jgi:hypothetical protein
MLEEGDGSLCVGWWWCGDLSLRVRKVTFRYV